MSKVVTDSIQGLTSGKTVTVDELYQRRNDTFNTLKRLASEAGFNLVDGSFEEGGVLDSADDVLWYQADGKYYSWGGALPKVVSGATPATSGGIVAGAWVDRTDATLRDDINVVVKRFDSVFSMISDVSLHVGQITETISYYDGWMATSIKPTGGNKYEIVVGGSGVSDGGSYIALTNGLQAKALFNNATINAAQFGCRNESDCTMQFVAIRNYINSIGHGELEFNSGEVYYYTNHKDASDPSFYGASPVFSFNNVRGLRINGSGCVLKALSGSKYGSFDPNTGAVYNPTLPFTNTAYANSPGTVWQLTDCSSVSGTLPEGDGNNQNLSLGGYYGDTGRQIQATYIRLLGLTRDVQLYSPIARYMALDGIAVKLTTGENEPSHNISFYNAVSEYNGRQGLSLSGGSHITFINPKFNHTGAAGVFSSPGAGIDIEPEAGNRVISPRFIGGESLNNKGIGALFYDLYDNSSDVVFEDFEVWGNKNSALWVAGGTNHKFVRGNIHGKIVRAENIEFTDTFIDDKNHPSYGMYVSGLYIVDSVSNATFRNCKIKAQNYKGPNGGSFIGGTIECAWDASYNTSGGTALVLSGRVEGLTVIDSLTGSFSDTSRFYVSAGTGSTFGANALTISGTGNGVRFTSRTGEWGEIKLSRYTGVAEISMKSNAAGTSTRILGARTSIPTSGDYLIGDIYFKTSPVAGGYIGWVCVVAGTPGTWKTFGTISA